MAARMGMFPAHLNKKFHVDYAWNTVVPLACRILQISSTEQVTHGENTRVVLKHLLVLKVIFCLLVLSKTSTKKLDLELTGFTPGKSTCLQIPLSYLQSIYEYS